MLFCLGHYQHDQFHGHPSWEFSSFSSLGQMFIYSAYKWYVFRSKKFMNQMKLNLLAAWKRSAWKLSLFLSNFSLKASVLRALSYFFACCNHPILKVPLITGDNYRNQFFSSSRHYSDFPTYEASCESPLMALYSLKQDMVPLI